MKFKDAKGREWKVQFNFRNLCRISDELEVDLIDNPTELPKSARKYVEIAWLLVEEQAEKEGVTPEDFGSSLDGNAFKSMQEALLLELAVFFEAPRPGVSILIRKSLEMNEKVMGAAKEEMESALERVCSELLGQSQ